MAKIIEETNSIVELGWTEFFHCSLTNNIFLLSLGYFWRNKKHFPTIHYYSWISIFTQIHGPSLQTKQNDNIMESICLPPTILHENLQADCQSYPQHTNSSSFFLKVVITYFTYFWGLNFKQTLNWSPTAHSNWNSFVKSQGGTSVVISTIKRMCLQMY